MTGRPGCGVTLFSLYAVEQLLDIGVLKSRELIQGPKLELLASFFATTFGGGAKHWVADSWRGGTDPRPPRPVVVPEEAILPKLRRPDAITDEFLALVAAHYRRAVLEGRSPALALAGSAKVPVRTIHRWVYEARKRGIMPPGRRGRVH
jgi:hypothetical protein